MSTGIFAAKMVFDVLREWNRNDVAYTIAGRRSFPGWGYMVEQDATTLRETRAYSDNVYSQNHPMFGSVASGFTGRCWASIVPPPGLKGSSLSRSLAAI